MASRLALLLTVAAAAFGEEVPTAVHVHTTWSEGALTIREVAERARGRGLRAVVLSDGYGRAARWGPPPLQGLVHWTRDRPSVRRVDLSAWLAEIEAASRAVPEVALVPGLELAPVCAWSGAPWAGGLRAEGLHVHVLAIGSRPHETYASLPSPTDGPLRWRGGHAPRCLLAVSAALAAWLFLRGRARWAAAPALLLALAWFPVGRGSALTVDDALAAASKAGFSAALAHPEALFPAHETSVEGVRVRTRPYPGTIVLSPATAFPTIYGDAHTAAGVGREWDRALLDYVEGRRPAPIWGIGEADFDGGGLVEIDTYHTVFFVDAPGAEALERALATGACYAAFAPGGRRVSMAFSISDPSTGASAGMGGTLRASGPVRVRVEASGGEGEATLTLVLDGRVWRQETGPLPLSREIDLDPPRGRCYLRATVARSGGGGSVGNPVFLER